MRDRSRARLEASLRHAEEHVVHVKPSGSLSGTGSEKEALDLGGTRRGLRSWRQARGRPGESRRRWCHDAATSTNMACRQRGSAGSPVANGSSAIFTGTAVLHNIVQ